MLYRNSNHRLRLVILVGIAAVTGCGTGSLHPVEGIVKFTDGTPVSGGNVVFSSVDLQPPVSAQGSIGPDGIFRLGTLQPGDGVAAGKYRVVIAEPLPTDLDHPSPAVIPPRYRDFASSGLTFEVVPGSNRLEIEIERLENSR